MEMDGFEIVEKSILELRVVELKDILEYIGLDTEGAKKVLQVNLEMLESLHKSNTK